MNNKILELLELAYNLYSEGDAEGSLMAIEDLMPMLIKEITAN